MDEIIFSGLDHSHAPSILKFRGGSIDNFLGRHFTYASLYLHTYIHTYILFSFKRKTLVFMEPIDVRYRYYLNPPTFSFKTYKDGSLHWDDSNL